MSRIDDLIRWEAKHDKRARKREKREAKATAERQEKLPAAFREMLPSLLPAIGQILMPGAFQPCTVPAPTPTEDFTKSVPEGWPFTTEELFQILRATRPENVSDVVRAFQTYFYKENTTKEEPATGPV